MMPFKLVSLLQGPSKTSPSRSLPSAMEGVRKGVWQTSTGGLRGYWSGSRNSQETVSWGRTREGNRLALISTATVSPKGPISCENW